MRPFIVTVLLFLVVALATATSASPVEKTSSDEQTDEKSASTKDDNESKQGSTHVDNKGELEKSDEPEASGCGKPNGNMVMVQLTKTVDAKTAKKIQKLMKKGKGKSTDGTANEAVKITIEAMVPEADAADLFENHGESSCDAKTGSGGASGAEGDSVSDDSKPSNDEESGASDADDDSKGQEKEGSEDSDGNNGKGQKDSAGDDTDDEDGSE